MFVSMKIRAWNLLEVVTVTPLKPDLAFFERSASRSGSMPVAATASNSHRRFELHFSCFQLHFSLETSGATFTHPL